MRKIELNLSINKDKKVMQWLELLKDMGIDSSPYVVLALEYYIKTGKFLSLGFVDKAAQPSDKLRKTFYIPNNSAVEDWSDELVARKRGLLSTQVRYILANCIESGEKGEIIPYAQLVMMADKDIYNGLSGNSTINSTTSNTIKPPKSDKIISYYDETEDEEIDENDARQHAIETMYNALLPDVDEE